MRDNLSDIIKGIAVILMIQVHLLQIFVDEKLLHPVLIKILYFLGGPPVAPLFIGVMGYYLVASNKDVMKNIQRGAQLIFLGFILNTLLNINLLYKYSTGMLEINILKYLFGVDILISAGFSIIIISLLKVLIKYRFYIYFLLAVIVFLTNSIIDIQNLKTNTYFDYILGIIFKVSDSSYFPLFPWLGYPLLGAGIYSLIRSKYWYIISNNYFVIFVSLLLISLVIYTFDYGLNISSHLDIYYNHDFIFAIWTVMFCTIFMILLNEINKSDSLNPFLSYFVLIGKNVTLVYIIQWILIGNIGTEIYKTQNFIQFIGWNLLINSVIFFIIVTLTHFKINKLFFIQIRN